MFSDFFIIEGWRSKHIQIFLQMEQDPQHRGSFEFSGRVNRDQRDLTISLNGTVDASDYPHDLTAALWHISAHC